MSVTRERRTTRPAGLDAATMAEAFQLTAAEHPDRMALRLKDDAFTMTWGEYSDKVRDVAAGLAGLGLDRGGTLALMLTNRPEFHFFDAAALHLGATPFSIYNTYAPEQIQYQVADAEARIVVTETAFLDRIKAVEGVELTHSTLIRGVVGFDGVIASPADGRVVSWLPMAHIAERACSHYLPTLLGFTTTCCPDPRQVVAYLPEVKPTWFFAVPRIWEKLKAAIEAGVAAEEDEAKKAATQWALEVGLRKVR